MPLALIPREEAGIAFLLSRSAQIRVERKAYYDSLERSQKGGLDISPWLGWFLDCLDGAFEGAESIVGNVLQKARFWEAFPSDQLNERQRKVLNRLLDGFEGNLTSSKWAALTKSSQDTAGRDIDDLVKRGALIKNPGGGRSTSYSLARLTARRFPRSASLGSRPILYEAVMVPRRDEPARRAREGVAGTTSSALDAADRPPWHHPEGQGDI